MTELALGDSSLFTEYSTYFRNYIATNVGVNNFAAYGCRPPYERTERADVTGDRWEFVAREAERGKTVITLR